MFTKFEFFRKYSREITCNYILLHYFAVLPLFSIFALVSQTHTPNHSRLRNKRRGTLINFGAFFPVATILLKGVRLLPFFIVYLFNIFFFLWLCIKKKSSIILRGGYAYSRGYDYCVCQMFQGLHLFKGVRLFWSLEHLPPHCIDSKITSLQYALDLDQ